MKYAVVAAAIAGVAVAMPAESIEWEGYTTTTKTTTWEPIKTTSTWEPVKETTTSTWSEYKDTTTWAPVTTKPATWSGYNTDYKCTTKTETYTTSECGDNKDAWDNCKTVTKTKYSPDEKCTWAGYTTTWGAAPVKEKCTYYSTWTTTECGDKTSAWDNCKVATKTTTVYKDEDKCYSTWAPVYTTKATTWSEVKASSTWSEVKASSTWAEVKASSTWAEVKASSTWAPAKVAQYTGAANKETFGKAAIAIAAAAMML